jgi:hypothetical protein
MTSVMDFDYEFRHPGHGDQSVHNPHKGGGAASFPVPNSQFIDKTTLVAAEFPHVGLSDKAKDVASRISDTRKVSETDDGVAVKTVYEATYTSKTGEQFQMTLQQSVGSNGDVSGRVDVTGGLGAAGFLTYDQVGRFIDTDKPTFAKIGYAGVNAPRMGLAGAMLEFGRAHSPLPIFHSKQLSPDGEAFAASIRADDFNYELRHPGAHDQKVHDPRKGGGAVPAGFVRPVATDPYFANIKSNSPISDAEFIVIAKSNGLDPQTLDADTFTAKEKLTPKELEAVEDYTDGSSAFQGAILGKKSPDDPVVERAATLKSVLESRSLDEPATLHRGMGAGMTARLQQAGVGGTVKTDRFVSTASHRGGTASFGSAILEIDAPAGTKGAWLDRLLLANSPGRAANRGKNAKQQGNPFIGEAEFVLPPGITFRIDSIGTTSRRRFGTNEFQDVPYVKVTIVS